MPKLILLDFVKSRVISARFVSDLRKFFEDLVILPEVPGDFPSLYVLLITLRAASTISVIRNPI